MPRTYRVFLRALPALAWAFGCEWAVPSAGAQASVDAAPQPHRALPSCGVKPLDAESLAALADVPERLADFCIDPYGLVRAYGPAEAQPLSRACERVLGPGCSDDEHGLDRVLSARYQHARGGYSNVDLVLYRFRNAEGAYAHFTERLIGDRDPAELSVRQLEVKGVGVLQGERVLAWRGRHVVWLRYTDETEDVEQRLVAAARDLSELARQLLETLPEDAGLPTLVERLPSSQRIPLGARLTLGDALGVSGLGKSACGYYGDGDKRWRVLAIARPDAESAKDVLSTLRRDPAARKIKGFPDAVSFTERRLPSEPHVGWAVGQRGSVVYGIGDEATVLPELMRAEREASVKLSLQEKLVKLSRINHR